MAKVGDTVRFLNSTGGGRIIRIEGSIAHVEDSDGFEIPVLLKECVVVTDASAAKAQPGKSPSLQHPKAAPQSKLVTETGSAEAEPKPELPVIETPEGEKLNIVIAFEPGDIKRLSSTSFEASLVNDSNYYISFALSFRAEADREWTLRKAGTVEPNIQLTIGEVIPSDLQAMDRMMIQYVAYKQGKPFHVKQPASVEIKIDTTKFFKLHCFKENVYFDGPVIAFDIVRDDRPSIPLRIDASQIEAAIRQKKAADRPAARPVRKRAAATPGIIEVDLHIHELVDSTRGLSNADMLNLQIDEFRKVMDANIKNHGQKIVFIHGKGEGVLRQALMKELTHRYKGHDVQDASFREYGFGATQVTIR